MKPVHTESRSQTNRTDAARRVAGRLLAPLMVLLATSIVYGAIYFREDSIPTAIGANLVPSERILKGEVPYRDFYKIQTPGILLLNAALFRLWGTSLLTAMTGVLAFKILSITMVFLTGRLAGSWKGALVSVALALVWLAPGGPFRPAPIQYEMVFTLSAMYLTLCWLRSRAGILLFGAGVAVGMVAIFKQNVGVYAAVALVLSIALTTVARPGEAAGTASRDEFRKAVIAAVPGIALPLAALFFYLLGNDALGPALDVFIRAPGEHIQTRFTGYALPRQAALMVAVGATAVGVASALVRRAPRLRTLLWASTVAAAAICAAFVPMSAIDNLIYWFSPMLFVCAGWIYLRQRYGSVPPRAEAERLLILLLFAMAAYGEVFPRAVRGLIIDTLPPSFLLLVFLFDGQQSPRDTDVGRTQRSDGSGSFGRRLAVAVAAIVLLIFALRIEQAEYLSISNGRVRFKADTELNFDRGRGIYLPAARAEEVNATVETIRSRVQPGGYFFAHALGASSYYFLSDRNSPTGATLWNDTGTNDRERVRTLAALKEKDVRLVLTSEEAMRIEPYKPLLDYLTGSFHPLEITIGNTVFLERNP